MSNITTLAEGQPTAVGTITIELVEADETSAVVIIRWPHKPCIIHPRRFPAAADNAARIIAAAAVWLRAIKRSAGCDRRCLRVFDNAQAYGSIRAPPRTRRSMSNFHQPATGGGHCPTRALKGLRAL
jgi:hypothetical protein